MDLVLAIHGRIAYALVLYFAAVGLWGLFLAARGSGPTPAFRGAVAIAVPAALAQGLLGLLVFAFLRGPEDLMHFLYGVLVTIAMPLAVSMSREQTPRRQALALGLASLFTAGLAIRGITTA